VHILMISDAFSPRVGGVPTSIGTFRRELQRLGHRVTLLVPDYGHGQSGDEDIIRVPSHRLVFDPEDRVMRARAILRMSKALHAQPPDLVHIQTPFVAHYCGVRVARALDVPVLESYHAFFEDYFPFYAPVLPKAVTRAATRYLWRRQCKEVDGLVVPSRLMADVLRGYGVRTVIEVIPTGIDRREFVQPDAERFRRRHGIVAGRPLLVHVGRVALEKNIGFLLRVVRELRPHRPDLLFVIVGQGPAQKGLEEQARRLGLREHVRFVGCLDRSTELPDCYAAADAFVFASRTETQALVVLEAMTFGVPVVSTSVMGTRETLPRSGQGALVAEEDPSAFAGQVLRVLDDVDLRRTLSERARAYAATWDPCIFGRRLADFYRRIAQGRRALGAAASF
jgi:1,2-diacylglycerol 3-alpha-glucosyltransferase